MRKLGRKKGKREGGKEGEEERGKTRPYTRRHQSHMGGQGQRRKLNRLSVSFHTVGKTGGRTNRRTDAPTEWLIETRVPG